MSTISDLLTEIEAFCKEAGIAEATFGTRAVNDGKFVGRLRGGANVTVGLVDRVRTYIAAERAKGASPSDRARPKPPKPSEAASRGASTFRPKEAA